MGGVINLIKKIFGGIFSFIGGFLGGKSGGYYMEAEELPKTAPAKGVEAAKPVPAQAIAAPPAKAEPAKTEAPESAKTKKAKAEKPAKTAKSEKAAKPEKAAPATAESNGSMNGSKPPVTANTLNLPQPTASYATETPMLTTPRRRPGANMGAFLEMAKTVKTPNN
jgi:hypothetical protein